VADNASLTVERLVFADREASRGIRRHGDAFQVRIHPFPAESRKTILEAVTLRDELLALRDAGVRHRAEQASDDPLSAWADRALQDKLTRGGRRGELSPRGVKYWTDAFRRWGGFLDENGERHFHSRDGLPERQRWDAFRDARGVPLAERPLSTLTLLEVESALQARVIVARNQAAYELQGLKVILELAQRHGARFDDRLVRLDPIVIPKSDKGHALDVEELAYLVERAPAHSRIALALKGTVGARLTELLTLTDDRVNLAERFWTIPASIAKERRSKDVPLMDGEVALVLEQMTMVRPAGATLVFPRPGGTPWRREHFYANVLAPARTKAIRDWRVSKGNDPDGDAPTPFDRIDNHRLRHTAITLMRRAGLAPELIAQRVGHNDGGALILKRYRHVGKDELRIALDGLGSSLAEALAVR
jgi:integrase